jgi:hypothetical protein
MVFDIGDEMDRAATLRRRADPDAFLDAMRTFVRSYENIERRLAYLEKRGDPGVASYMLLFDLLLNLRSNGGLTKTIVDDTITEIIAYLEERGGPQCARLTHLLKAFQDPESTWE